MLSYLLKRFLIFIPTLWLVSLIAFGLSRLAPGSPLQEEASLDTSKDIAFWEKEQKNLARSLGLDKPPFYFSITSKAYPADFYQILTPYKKITQQKLLEQYGNWEDVSSYYAGILDMERLLMDLPDSSKTDISIKVKKSIRSLYTTYLDKSVENIFGRIEEEFQSDSFLNALLTDDYRNFKNKYVALKENANPSKLYIPSIHWYGFDNQYHNWLMNFIKGDFGISYIHRRPVADMVKPALSWTISLSLVSIFLAYIISIPLGVYSAVLKNSWFDRITTFLLFAMYSLPVFWIATILLVFFTTSEYGMNWFDGVWISQISPDAPFMEQVRESFNHLVLPIICLTYTSFAFLVRQMRGSMLDVKEQLYIRTARAKGLGEQKVIWKHAFRNALFPIITIFASVLPAIITGSVVVEFIYQIPGMGWRTLESIREQDWPVVFSILMLGSVLTMIGILISDILYVLADPRVSFKRKL